MNLTLLDVFAGLAMLAGDLFTMMSVVGSAMMLVLAILSAVSSRRLRATDQVLCGAWAAFLLLVARFIFPPLITRTMGNK